MSKPAPEDHLDVTSFREFWSDEDTIMLKPPIFERVSRCICSAPVALTPAC
jgi:hypothetical protein